MLKDYNYGDAEKLCSDLEEQIEWYIKREEKWDRVYLIHNWCIWVYDYKGMIVLRIYFKGEKVEDETYYILDKKTIYKTCEEISNRVAFWFKEENKLIKAVKEELEKYETIN